jgi:methylated-DNA-protein-cysteine methyltransferase-like protein
MRNPTAPRGSDLYEAIYELVRAVPAGRVTTYGAIAEAIGLKSGARLVGYALAQSHPVVPAVPAHRVVNRIGLLTGRHHFSPPEAMEAALATEGVVVEDNQVQDFENRLWRPLEHFDLG